MNSQNDKDGSPHVRAAIIAGIFAVVAACIGGVFLVIVAFINNGFVFAGAGNQNPYPTTAPVSTQPPNTSIPVIPPTSVPEQSSYPKNLCPYAITQSDVNSLNIGVADVETVRTYIEQFDAGRPNDGGAFTKGTKIPAGVVIATNFDEVNASAWSQYPVIPLVHSGSWGLFQSIGEYIAPNAGACRVITP